MSDSRIQLSNGVLFDLLEPDPDLIDIEVIASALSKLCRFTGHTAQFYSVAQHCVVVSRLVEPEYALAGLLHDATEAFVGDVSTPLKALLPEYKRIEEGLAWAIMEAFRVETEFTTSVKHADLTAMATERRDLGIVGNDEYWSELPDPAPWTIVPLEHEAARVAFMARFAEIVLRPGEGQAPVGRPVYAHTVNYERIKQPNPERFDTNEDVSRRLAEAEVDETKEDRDRWEVIG